MKVKHITYALLVVSLFCAAAPAADLAPRPLAQKPARTIIEQHQYLDRITVKFHDGLHVRARNNVLTDEGTGALNNPNAVAALNTLRGGIWRPTHPIDEPILTRWRQTAQLNLNKQVADLNLQFDYHLPAHITAAAAIDLLNTLDVVELAQPMPLPAPPPLPRDFQPGQGYLKISPGGINALGVWETFTTTGAGIKIADIEYSWNLNHQDFPAITLVGPQPVDPFNSTHHGTAVLGELASQPNAFGTTGIAHSAQFFVIAVNTNTGYSMPAAMTRALSVLGPGDILLIEQQTTGPAGGSAYVPVEWFKPTYDAIVTATGNGITVIEAAGNGNQNLDGPSFSTGNGGHWPFLAQNDSGAIIVGAGAAFQIGSDIDRSRLAFSTYGSTVDLQGWGEQVLTTGFGNFYASEGANLFYTANFSGTSSASPIVAGAAALVQSKKKAFDGVPFTPAQVRQLLRDTGSPQQSGVFPSSQNIGPRPNVLAAIEAAGLVITNDLCVNATLKSIGTHGFSTGGATTDGPDEPAACNFGGSTQIDNDVWFKFVSPCTGTATVSLCGASFNTKMAIYQGCWTEPGHALACNDDFCGQASQVTFAVQTSMVYRVRIGGFNGATGGGTMTISCDAAPTCDADVSGDGQVNVNDLLAVVNSWGACVGCPADVNGDDMVNVNDLLQIVNHWGPCP